MPAPLDGILVLDLSRVLAGPFCTMLLGDLGARIIKDEHPEEGDVTRGWGPPHDPVSGLSAYYLSINRNKESLALDLSTPEGAKSVRILSARADVLIENFPPGGLEKFGLSLVELRRENPRLVTASITGFGRTGPDASAPGFDLLAQAGAGIMAITGTPESGPTKVGVAVSDLFAGCFTAVGIAAALCGRERTGTGTHAETDLFSSTLASSPVSSADCATEMRIPRSCRTGAFPRPTAISSWQRARTGSSQDSPGCSAARSGRKTPNTEPTRRVSPAAQSSKPRSKRFSGGSRAKRGWRACGKRECRQVPCAGRSKRSGRRRPERSPPSSFRAEFPSFPRRSV